MKSKKSNKLCVNCTRYNGANCTHKSNLGIKVKYRQESSFYLKTSEELNADGKCENYAKV